MAKNAMKTIITTITLTNEGEDKAPGTPVTLPAEEADSILDRFGGQEIKGGSKKSDDSEAAKETEIAALETAVTDAAAKVDKASNADEKKAAELELKKAQDALAAAKQ